VAIGIGDLGLAYQSLKVAISVDANHVESFTNLGVLELRKGNLDAARANFTSAQARRRTPHCNRRRVRPGLRVCAGLHPRGRSQHSTLSSCARARASHPCERGFVMHVCCRTPIADAIPTRILGCACRAHVAQELAPYMFEPFFNGALLAYKLGDFQEAHALATKALVAFPEHTDSQELLRLLSQQFSHQ
jgi:tetratricopeptide (TPR) repeat protein